MKKGDRVCIRGLDASGVIINVRDGKEFGGTILTIGLDDSKITPGGLYYARPGEVVEVTQG